MQERDEVARERDVAVGTGEAIVAERDEALAAGEELQARVAAAQAEVARLRDELEEAQREHEEEAPAWSEWRADDEPAGATDDVSRALREELDAALAAAAVARQQRDAAILQRDAAIGRQGRYARPAETAPAQSEVQRMVVLTALLVAVIVAALVLRALF